MTRPHPALIDLAAERPLPAVAEAEVDELVASAAEHRMTGLLFTRAERGELTLPRPHLLSVVRADLRQQAHHLALWRALDDVQRRLDAIGVRVATFKGVSAQARWYDRLGERPCTDLDLLLDPGAVHRIDEVVATLQPGHVLVGELGELMPTGVLPSVDLDVDGVEIDLHTDLLKVEIPTRQPTVIWDRTVPVTGPEGIRVPAPDPEISLVHLLLHLNKDRFSRLLGFADVARLLAREELDWDVVDRFLAGEGLATPAYCALDAVVTTLGLPPPPVAPHRGPRAVMWRALWPPERRLRGRVGMTVDEHRQFWIPWMASGRAAEALRWWVRRRLLPPPPLVRLYYPDTAGPYVWRRLVGRVRAARRNREEEARVRAADERLAGREPAPSPSTSEPTGSRAPLRALGGASPVALADERYKTFPPRWSHIRVPTSSRAAAASALMLYAPCRVGGLAIRTAAWCAVRLGGVRVLPGPAGSWTPPVDADEWADLVEQWRTQLGPFDTLGAYAPPQAGRGGGSYLLIRDGRPTAFVKVRRDTARPGNGPRALALLERTPPSSFWAPRVLAAGDAATCGWVALSTFPVRPHRPARHPPLAAVTADIERALEGLPRPETVAAHWRPMHGDLTPWNLRTIAGRRILLDWEDAGWGPPGADAAYFEAVAAALWRRRPPAASAEATAFWREHLRERVREGKDEQLLRDVDRALVDMGRPGGTTARP